MTRKLISIEKVHVVCKKSEFEAIKVFMIAVAPELWLVRRFWTQGSGFRYYDPSPHDLIVVTDTSKLNAGQLLLWFQSGAPFIEVDLRHLCADFYQAGRPSEHISLELRPDYPRKFKTFKFKILPSSEEDSE